MNPRLVFSGDWRLATGGWYYRRVQEAATTVFARGAMVLVTLHSPREKFWGVILELTPVGLGVRGVDLNCLDDFARLVREGEAASAGAVFFPLHRVERIELDVPGGGFPSLGERFAAQSGRQPAAVLETASPVERG